jgi:hypothetical protein
MLPAVLTFTELRELLPLLALPLILALILVAPRKGAGWRPTRGQLIAGSVVLAVGTLGILLAVLWPLLILLLLARGGP